ncbi:MAG: spondin domain-containing protein, partial [Pseudomonadota bacterium]
MKHLRKWAIGAVAAAACLTATSSIAASIKITFTNSQASEGLYLTPFFSTVHDGTFDIFDPNTRASDELEALAEDGNPAPLVGAATDAGFAAQVAFGPGVPPVLAPGESATVTFNGIDRLTDRFLSFASMVIPSNDIFLGNPDPIQLFDDTGAFSATAPIVLTSAQAWDGGTEANNNRGAAFNAAGGTAFDTDARIRL